MSAQNEYFPWASHYGHFEFFESRMRSHSRVEDLQSQGNGVYLLKRIHGDSLKVFICECYSYGLAEYMETEQNLGKLDVVIINSIWCGYTYDAKHHCRDNKVGLFDIGEFMAALNKPQYWTHLTEEQKEYFEKKGWA